tara:strand:- start:379 stop:1452 length:1074 start_codon:yes stop_codon:yes gene_type:complete
MRKDISKILYVVIMILVFGVSAAFGQGDFFKYSTFYTSMTMNTPFTERGDYIAVDKGYEDVTQVHPYDYNLTIGLRKIARMDYEYKVKTWYYGTEKAVADNVTIGNSVGWEYLLNYSFIRNRGDKFTEQNFWLRYLGEKCVTKVQYKDNQRVNLRYNSFDTRFRVNKGNWDFTIGGVFRMHPVYGVNPIEDFWVPGESTFQQLAEDFGYAPEQWIQGFYVNQNWYDVSGGDSVLVATSNDEFFNHYFGDAVATYNERELDKLGMQKEISAVIGLAYYKYTPKFWLHAWANCMPFHYGMDEYSFEYGVEEWDNMEWDAGLVFGSRITKSLGMFVEGTHMRYWMKPVYEVKFGFNYLIF